MVSCGTPTYRADVVRLIHGDPRPIGPGFKEELVASDVNKEYPGRHQPIHPGSYVTVPHSAMLGEVGGLTLQAWVYCRASTKGVQSLICKRSAIGGYDLLLDERGCLALWIGAGKGQSELVSTNAPLQFSTWYFVAATFDAGTGYMTLFQDPLRDWPEVAGTARIGLLTSLRGVEKNKASVMIGNRFNGKIDSPKIFGRALAKDEIESLKGGDLPSSLSRHLLASWDFSVGTSSTKVTDTSGNEQHGCTVNNPARAVTGHNWTGKEVNFNLAPAEYGAIQFHDDDLEDAGWEVDFELKLPREWKSGVYAVRVRSGETEDHIPFFVRPSKGASSSRIALILPTLTYLAYANHLAREDGLISLYNCHSDGSDNLYASWRRPLLDFRPQSMFYLTGGPCHFSADLCLVDWLKIQGYDVDVFTDEGLHREGVDLIRRYRVVLTGSHPEYYTLKMLEGIDGYTQQGGRLMYLGANGFYWVTSIDPERPHIMEVRRGQAGAMVGTYNSGEGYHSTTGECGGVWRHRGWAPQRLVGIGTNSGCVVKALPYKRQPGSFNPRAAFIFEGIGKDELIGDFGLSLGGAAGHEMDRLDFSLGTPPHSLLLATATGYTDPWICREDDTANAARCDMVYFECPQGGAVFSVGSMTWVTSLSHNQYKNNVSRITQNVLNRFLAEAGCK